MPADTLRRAAVLRDKGVDLAGKRLLVTRLEGSAQEADLSEAPNCGGLGRLRHFRRTTSEGWPMNSLPIDPARHSLGMGPGDEILAQAFQNAICDWRCWYCFVPFELLSANQKQAEWVDAGELVDRYVADGRRAPMIDLTGGQPDLVPEWTLWMMEALHQRGLSDSTYVWVDDNLSSDNFWRYLTPAQIDLIKKYPRYGRVGCFKGFDGRSFSFNTGAAPEHFDRQFEVFARHVSEGEDCYAYVTLTTETEDGMAEAMSGFVDRLQRVAELLPLRTVPLEIATWGPVYGRLNETRSRALRLQSIAISAWNNEIEQRFSVEQRARPIYDLALA